MDDLPSARPLPEGWRSRYQLPPGDWWLAPEALNYSEAEAWAARHGCFDVLVALSSGDTAVRRS